MASKLIARLIHRNNRNGAVPLSPAERVTQTYELLEQILEHLDNRTLRQAQLANKYWHSIIHKSSVLEARLHAKQGGYLRALNTVLIAMQDVGVDSLVKELLKIGRRSAFVGYDPLWSHDFRKKITVDKYTWILDGDYSCNLGAHEFSDRMLGHALANSDAFMLFYSVDSRESFDVLKAWVAKMNSDTEPLSMFVRAKAETSRYDVPRRPEVCIPAAVVSTKNDLSVPEVVVPASEGAALARELGCAFVETSAVSDLGICQAFDEVPRAYKRAWTSMKDKQRSKRASLRMRIAPSSAAISQERKQKWWSWYRANRQPP